MKRILSLILTFTMMFSIIGGISMVNTETAYARVGVDKDGNPVDNHNVYQPTDDPVYYYQPPVDENGNHDYFGYKMYDDPQDITDEEFFGRWDDVIEQWVLGPYFRYSEYPAMAPVEAAAKAGDYELAKQELYNYYLNVNDRNIEVYSASLDSPLALEQMSRNVFSYTKTSALDQGPFILPADDWGKAELDVLRAIKQTPGSYTEFNLMVASADKYWTTGQIYSREADESLRPVLRMTVNGVVTERYPCKDTMIVGGTEKNTNFGSDTIIELQEHGNYDNTNESYGSYNEDTKRSFIAFDLSDLKQTDKITSAKVIFTGRSIITDETRKRFPDENGNPYSGEAREKLMWATWYKSSAWNEKELVWSSSTISDKHFFSCHDLNAWDFVTSRSTSIKGKVCVWHRGNMQSDLRNGYLYYKDERYAYTCLRYYMAMANSIWVDNAVMNSLDVSVCIGSMAETIHALKNSKYMTPEIMTCLIKYLWALTEHEERVWFGHYDNNWGSYATSGVYDTCAYFPEFAMHDYWYESVRTENDRLLSGQTFEDGLCVEIPQGYISTLLDTFEGPMYTYQRTGHPGPYSEELYEDIHNVVKSMLYTTGPYLSGFNIGDSGNVWSSRKATFQIWYDLLFSDDEEFLWVISNGTSGKMPENPTTTYPIGLESFMRSGWDKKSLQMSFINNTDSRRSHGHYDALSVAMFAYGKYLLVDPGYGNDQTSDNGRVWEYNRSPIQHNMMTINDTYDYIYDGVCCFTKMAADSSWEKDFESNKAYDFIEYVCDGYSTAQTMQRSVTFMKNQKFWIISDYGVPTDPTVENVFAQHWHMYPQANPTHNENYVVRSNFEDVNVMIVPLEHEEIENLQYVDGYYGEKSGQKILHPKAMITKSNTGAGRFTTVILPVNVNENFEVTSSMIENKNNLDDALLNMAYFKITETNTGTTNFYYYYHINDASKKPAEGVKVANFTTDATTLVVQQNSSGETVSIFLTDGSYVKDTNSQGGYLFKADTETTVSFTRNGQFVNITSSLYDDASDVANMSVYMPTALAARLDSDDLTVNITDGVMTFDGTYGSSNITSGGGTGGGGGGGAGGAGPKPETPDDTQKEPVDDNNNQVEPPLIDNPVIDTPDNVTYSDVAEKDWYYEDVTMLSEKGIVSGDGTGNFSPNSNVTREQFLKMLIEAAEVDVAEGDNTFEDVSPDAWYKPYVLKAKNFGIVNGVSDTKFGIGTNITRQDMAVMLSRVIEKLEIDVSGTQFDKFADNENISEYAKDAVQFMKSIGLIEGYNNEFRPKDNLTRAEAATIIAKFIKNFKI